MDEHMGPGEHRTAPSCPVALCPICTFVSLAGEARPEVVEHLLKAGQEFLLAVRAVIDTRTSGPPAPAPDLERIEVE